jgi:MFS family permease
MSVDRFTATRRDRFAITAVFAGNGVLFASLFARMPEVQERLRLDEGALGLALLAAPAGLIGSVALAGPRVARHGSRRVAALSAPGYAAALVLPAVAPSFATLALALFALGATSGALDVAMNTQGLAVERRYPRRIFASLHAGYSFGALAGAASAGLIAYADVPLTPHLLAVAATTASVMALAIRRFVPDRDAAHSAAGERSARRRRSPLAEAPAPFGPAPARPPVADRSAPGAATSARRRRPRRSPPVRAPRALLGLGAVAFCVLLAEGALNDWSSVYLARVHDAAPGTAAAGLAAVSLCMGGGRLVGDRLAAAFGSRAMICCGLALGAAGFAAAAVAPGAPAVLVAYAGLGLGLASVYPLVMRAAAERRDVPAGVAIGGVTTLGYVGFLLGPPLIGLLAHASSLRASFALVGGLCLLAAGLSREVIDSFPRRVESEDVWQCPHPAPSSARISS